MKKPEFKNITITMFLDDCKYNEWWIREMKEDDFERIADFIQEAVTSKRINKGEANF
jgi:hypothetical protein